MDNASIDNYMNFAKNAYEHESSRQKVNEEQKIIVLIGPNGVGKSHICRTLAKHNLCNYISLEEVFMEKYISLENFRNNRDDAYLYFENLVRSTSKDVPIIFEESGISDQATHLITNLKKDYRLFVVEISADLKVCIERVRRRGTTQNFYKDDQFVIDSEKRYISMGQKKYDFDLSIENNNLDEEKILKIFTQLIIY